MGNGWLDICCSTEGFHTCLARISWLLAPCVAEVTCVITACLLSAWRQRYPARLQSFVSRARVDSFSLTADMMYVSTNAPRIARAVFEIALRRGWSGTAELALRLCKVTRLCWCWVP